MPRQSRAPREGLLTVRIRAFVRPFTRVNSTMASQRAAVTERLATPFADVRLFTSMDALVDGQRGSLNKLLVAAWIIADMGSDATVDSLVSGEIASSCKSFMAGTACEILGRRRLLRPIVWFESSWGNPNGRHAHR